MSELQWPPRREDLEELYVRQRLSAAKIAERYGLRYASPKTAESTILYHLKRAGIARRDAAEHIRTVTPEMVDEWVRRYGAGESLKDISGSLVSPATVFNHLRRRGVELRDKVDAQIVKVTKFQKSAFNGEEAERMY
ncbi:MAG TPA: hypothetical protein VEJ36_06835, partial [Nitrososphaerales archaeon]|nr:hypothetical protein [Nitrososphaerales archaeon]